MPGVQGSAPLVGGRSGCPSSVSSTPPPIGALVGLTTGGGFGDAKAGALWGLGWYGWTTVRDGTTVALLLAASYMPARLVSGRGFRNGQVALGPILLLAGCLVRLLVVA